MESQDKFRSYADVNKEIQALIASKENTPHYEATPRRTESEDLLTLLETLNKTYSEINTALHLGDSQALKDVILKSDIKMSMVCETLLETLRKTTEEKNNLIRETQALEKSKRELETTGISNKVYIEKLRSDVDFKRINVEELNRVISDQKSRMAEFKEECVRARSEVQFFKAKIDEIENLRGRANERMGMYEKELEALNAVIKDKDSRVQMLVVEKRNEEERNAGAKSRVVELESMVEALTKKLELKEKNASLCNSELSKVLCDNKRLKVEHEKYKESSTYYEGLYNSLSSQNAYLNSQLNKMLKMEEYSKDVDGSILRFKKKLKKRKRKIKKLESENVRLRREEETPDDTSEFLLKKIENLNEENEKYKTQLSELEDEKRRLEGRMKTMKLGTEEVPFKERVKSLLSGEQGRSEVKGYVRREEPSKYLSFRTYKPPVRSAVGPALGPERVARDGLTRDGLARDGVIRDGLARDGLARDTLTRDGLTRDGLARDTFTRDGLTRDGLIRDTLARDNSLRDNLLRDTIARDTYQPLGIGKDNTPLYAEKPPHSTAYQPGVENVQYRGEPYQRPPSDSTYLRLFNLENTYEDKPAAQSKPGNDFVGGFVTDSEVPKPRLEMDYDGAKGNDGLINRGSVHMSNLEKLFGDKEGENASVESVKTYHTSSTLKEMMAKTENLKKKFDDLEGKLAQINEGESIDRLTDKIKACNSYYSEWNADSNESDYI